MVDPDSGTAATAEAVDLASDLKTYFRHGRKQPPLSCSRYEDRRFWGEPQRGYSGVQHNNANRKKKAKRKQAQASRRKNRR